MLTVTECFDETRVNRWFKTVMKRQVEELVLSITSEKPFTNYGENYALQVQKFMNFLDTVLFVHEKPKIQKFLLTVTECLDETRVNKWFRTAIKLNVEELVLSMTPEYPLIFPLSFFTSDSLVVLELEYDGVLNLPNTISFPRIKILRFTYIDFVNENLTGKLFSNCPILEELSLFDCDFHNFKVLCITSPSLKHLSIRNCRLLHQTLKVFAPNLLTLTYAADLPADFVLDSFQSLVEADVQIFSDLDQARIYGPSIKLYQKLSNGLSAANTLLADLSTFCNLVRLKVSSAFWGGWDPHASFISSMKIFLWFLQLSPNL
ncbi:F-box/LRR-repeat protein At3g59200-like isoform X2 [Papaver somniferum]|uniref:F-box/LRR-repeat protein At3g59200-like isoform X2 n=1 Tax=Papaver somniferum TaxID=3469 RepID=UPI000E6F9CF6|nr:F-box/LRR-repeat protein At3g59200-like isoform X2 [Papaver somniferum]